jgi:hypothetical protein
MYVLIVLYFETKHFAVKLQEVIYVPPETFQFIVLSTER